MKFKSGKSEKEKEKKKVFGAVLDPNCTEIPRILESCVEYLDATGLDVEGVFRKSGSLNMMNKYQEKFDNGEDVDFSDVLDPHIVAGLLKKYIREYPEPLLTFELYDCFLAAVAVPDITLKVPKVKQVLTMLPPANLLVVKYLVSFLSRVSAHSSTNFMTPSNLAIVFAPNLLRPPYEGDKGVGIMMEDTPYANELLKLLISHYEPLFNEQPHKPTPKATKALPAPPVAAATRPPAASNPLPALPRSVSDPAVPSSIQPPPPPKRPPPVFSATAAPPSTTSTTTTSTFVTATPTLYPTDLNPFAPAPPPKTSNRKNTKPLPHVPSSEIVAPTLLTHPTQTPTPTTTPTPTASAPAPPPKPTPAPPPKPTSSLTSSQSSEPDTNPFGNPFETTNPFETPDSPPEPTPKPLTSSSNTVTPISPTSYPTDLNPFGPKRLPSPPPYQAPPPPTYNAPPPPYTPSAPPSYAPPSYQAPAPPSYNAPPPPYHSLTTR